MGKQNRQHQSKECCQESESSRQKEDLDNLRWKLENLGMRFPYWAEYDDRNETIHMPLNPKIVRKVDDGTP
jgi:hypothetical protein